jgi:multidrug efflux pump subunit AcrA (membrane-fusion protein)
MSVEANVITREKADVMLVPPEAVRGTTVFVIDGNHVRRRDVKVGIRGTRAVEIESGLSEADRIASPANDALADRRRVRVIEKKTP